VEVADLEVEQALLAFLALLDQSHDDLLQDGMHHVGIGYSAEMSDPWD